MLYRVSEDVHDIVFYVCVSCVVCRVTHDTHDIGCYGARHTIYMVKETRYIWQKRPRELDFRVRLENEEMTHEIHDIGCYRVAKTHRIPYLYRSFSAKVTYI